MSTAPVTPGADEIAVDGTPSTAMPLAPIEPATDPPKDESVVLGVSGQKYASGHKAEEYHADLSDPQQAIEEYDQLRTGSALVAGPLARIEDKLRQAEWDFAPGPRLALPPSIADLREKHDLDSEDVALEDLESEAIQLHRSWLLGSPAQEYAMETSWRQQVLHEACTSLAFPASVFEIVWRRVDGRLGTKIVPQVLRWMHPRSIRAFKIDENGRFKGIVQATQHSWDPTEDESFGGHRSNYHRKFIPVRDLLIVSRNREGTQPEGTPLIRHMYADAKRAQAAIQWQLIDAQNRAVGIPFVEIPKGVHGKIVESVKQQARRMTYGNQHLAYVVAPEGIKVGFVDMSANVVDLAAIVTAQERRMRHVSGTEFTALGGESGSGSLALAKVLREEFNSIVTGIASAVIEDIQRGLVERVHAINYRNRLSCPQLTAGGLVTIDAADLALLIEHKALTVDADVTNAARRTIGLGPVSTKVGQKVDTAQLNDLAMAKAIAVTGDVLNAVHEAIGLPPLPPAKVAEYNVTPFNAPTPGLLAPAPAAPHEPAADQPPTSFSSKPPGKDERKARGEALRDARKAAVERVVERLLALRAAAVREIAGKATTGGSGRLGGRLEPSKETREKFRAALRSFADQQLDHGRASAREEIARGAQAHGRLVRFASTPDPKKLLKKSEALQAKIENELDVIVELNADAILDAIEPMLRQEFFRQQRIASSTAEALEKARELVAEWGIRPMEQAANQAAAVAVTRGRALEMDEARELLAIEGLVIDQVTRIHVGDDKPCDYCYGQDGKVYKTDSHDYLENEPPNNCEGGDRCHCHYAIDITVAPGTKGGKLGPEEDPEPKWRDD